MERARRIFYFERLWRERRKKRERETTVSKVKTAENSLFWRTAATRPAQSTAFCSQLGQQLVQKTQQVEQTQRQRQSQRQSQRWRGVVERARAQRQNDRGVAECA